MSPDHLRIEHWPIGRFVFYARNPRKNDQTVERMCASIQEFGFRIPVVVRSDGTVVDGHLRLKAAQRLCMAEVPVVLADDLSEAQIKAFRLLANRSATWAEWDEELLALELQDLEQVGFDLSLTGFDLDEIDRMLTTTLEDSPTSAEDADVPEPPADPVTKPGDLWVLGQHRLLCGDATVLEHVETVLAGERAAMAFSDPPYNVDYTGGTKGKRKKIANDDLGNGFSAFLFDACVNILSVTDGAVYLCMSSSELHTLYKAFTNAGGHWSTFVIWCKNSFTLGRSDYQRQYEPILYGWREGALHHWCGARDQGDVWQIARPRVNDLHPTMKPVELVERAVTNSSRRGDVVLDPFGGSGTTLIACERTGRQARLVELDPGYCDVIVKRWQEAVGKAAVLHGDGRSFDDIAGNRS